MRKMSKKKLAEALNNIIETNEADCDSGNLITAATARTTFMLASVSLHLLSLVPDDVFKGVELLTDSKTKKLADETEENESE